MRATLMYGAGDVRIEPVPDAQLKETTDAIVRVVALCVDGGQGEAVRVPQAALCPALVAGCRRRANIDNLLTCRRR